MRLKDFFIKHFAFYVIGCLVVLPSCNKETQTIQVYQAQTDNVFDLSDVTFMNEQIGFACGGIQFDTSVVVKTVDGGAHWTKVKFPADILQKKLYAIASLSNGTIITAGYGGVIFFSIDSGNSWQSQQDQHWREWHDICFKTTTQAYYCGRGPLNFGYITHMNYSWKYSLADSKEYNFAMTDIDFPTQNIAYIAGYGAVSKSVDGGEHWSFTSAKDDFFTSMSWFNELEGVIVGWEGSICKTIDGGETWKRIRNGNKLTQKKIRLKAIEKNQRGELVAVGEKGCCMYSADQGESWTELSRFTQANLESIYWRDENTFFVVGEGGLIFKLVL